MLVSSRFAFGVCGLFVAAAVGCQSPSGLFSNGYTGLNQDPHLPNRMAEQSARGQSEEADEEAVPIVEAVQDPAVDPVEVTLLPAADEVLRSSGSGRLGKRYVAVVADAVRYGDKASRMLLGTVPALGVVLRTPVDQQTDLTIRGGFVNHTKNSTVNGTAVGTTVEGQGVSASLWHRFGNDEGVNPFVAVGIGYANLHSSVEIPSEPAFRSDRTLWSWNVSVGGEVQVSPKFSVLAGLGLHNSFDRGSADLDVGFELGGTAWLTDEFFFRLGGEVDLDKDVSYLASLGFEF